MTTSIGRLGSLAAAILAVTLALPAAAAELLMFEEAGCPWCRAWDRDIGDIYDKTTEGKRAPLRRIDVHGPMPEGLTLTSRPRITPTFVLIDKGRELGRIEGYPGDELFWWLMSDLMNKLPDDANGEGGS